MVARIEDERITVLIVREAQWAVVGGLGTRVEYCVPGIAVIAGKASDSI